MHRHLLAISSALALATLLGCASSSKPPDDPSGDTKPDFDSDTPKGWDTAGPRDNPEPAPPKAGELKKEKGADNAAGSIPDDYMITNGDCVMLGRALAGVTRADELSKLSPKLNEKQRAQAEESIDAGSSKTGDKFAEGCQKSSAGSNGDPKALKCALNAKTANEFTSCLNGPVPPK